MAYWYTPAEDEHGMGDELLLDFDNFDKAVHRYGCWGMMFRQRLRDAINAGLLEIAYTEVPTSWIIGHRYEVMTGRETEINPGGIERLDDIFLVRSNSKEDGHFHVFIRLAHPMSLWERMNWQERLGSDWRRSQADQMRAARGIKPASLLIRTHKVEGLWREPDYECPCPTGKHETLKQVEAIKAGTGCPIWQKLRGATPWELYGQPAHDGMESVVNLPLGRVPMDLILKVAKVK